MAAQAQLGQEVIAVALTVLLKEWIAFLDAVTVCNTDDAAHPCR